MKAAGLQAMLALTQQDSKEDADQMKMELLIRQNKTEKKKLEQSRKT